MQQNLTELCEKWDHVLAEETEAPIVETHRKKVTAQLLENQQIALSEATPTNVAGGMDNWDPILIKLARRMAPKLIAFDVCGVQAMSGPTGLVFAMRARYTNPAGAEALHNEADTSHSGAGTHAQDDPFHASYEAGTGMATSVAEGDTWNQMAMTIEKTSVEAKSRQLKANYSVELAQDLKAIHGLDAENELANILTGEIITEINREVIRTIYRIAPLGAAFASTPGTFDLDVDADGRWSVEKFKGLIFAIERDANAIALATRRGKGNFLICSADVASALSLAGVLDYAPALNAGANLDVDITGTTFAGVFKGKYKVFIDPYATGDFYVVGYKGSNQYDAGFFYCPYTPLQLHRATDSVSMQPIIGFKTRYGMVANPYTDMTNGGNSYYRKVKVTNLL